MTRATRLLWTILFTLLFFVAAVGVETYLINMFIKAWNAVNWPTTKGIIVKSELEKHLSIKTSYEAFIEYTYQIGEKQYKSKDVRARGSNAKYRSELTPLVEKFPAGKEVTVYYNPVNPSDALLEVGVDGIDQLVVVLPVLLILFSGVGLIALILEWRKGPNAVIELDESKEEDSDRIWGPRVRFHCHNCKTEVAARTYMHREVSLTQPESHVECIPCGIIQSTKLPLQELDHYSADELIPHLYTRVSVVVKFLAIASIVFFLFPFVGFVFGGIGLLASKHTGGWTKRVSLIGFVLSSVVLLGFICLWIWA